MPANDTYFVYKDGAMHIYVDGELIAKVDET
jgi:hypothetical protein